MCASPFTFAEALRHHPGNSGRYDAGGVHRLYGREIDEIMQEEETEKLGQDGRTGERFDRIRLGRVARLARVRVPEYVGSKTQKEQKQ